MKIISHRGLWKKRSEKNTEESFNLSFQQGFGTETDIRDLKGKLVISHDTPIGNEMEFSNFLSLISKHTFPEPPILALNIKSDGLAHLLSEQLSGFTELDAFVFDMSIPDMQSYFQEGFQVFTRMSEVEIEAAWLEKSSGVWLDSFDNDWFTQDVVSQLLKQGKRVCIVSPELHGRDHKNLWEEIAVLKDQDDLILCTDHPIEAKKFFGL